MAQSQCPNCTFPFIPMASTKCPNCGWVMGTPVTPSAAAPTPKLSAPATLHQVVNDTTRSAGERAAAQEEIKERNV
jgi:hypothetical protein